MKKMNLNGLFIAAILVAFTFFMAANVNAETPQKAAVKVGTDASKKAGLNKKVEGINEAPNSVSKNEQASGDSNKEGKKKLEELFDKPNPMESKVKTNADKALGIETGTKGKGGEPVNPEKMMNMKK